MNFSKVFLLLILLFIAPILSADEASKKEAEKLLDMMGMQEMMDQSVSQMLDIQLQQQPDLAPFKEVMIEFFNKNMSYEIIKPELIKMYSEAFTAPELKEIIAFYSTDVGQKSIKKMPALTAQGAQLGATRVQQNIGDLQAMIEAEAERLGKLK